MMGHNCVEFSLIFAQLSPDFRQRFIRLLGSTFRSMEFKLAMRLVFSFIYFPALRQGLDYRVAFFNNTDYIYIYYF